MSALARCLAVGRRGVALVTLAVSLGQAGRTGAQEQQSTFEEFVTILGEAPDAELGWAVGGGGDVDGDGVPDVLVAAPYDSTVVYEGGRAFLFTGAGLAAGGTFTTADAAGSFHATERHRLGWSATIVDDVDGDGLDELWLGAPRHFGAADFCGAAYLVFGQVSGWALDQPIDDVAVRFLGEAEDDHAGAAVAGAGDADGDGLGDLLVGAPGDAYLLEGQAYLLLGRAGGWAPASTLADADVVFTGQGQGHEFGAALDGGCDTDGDGLDDVLIGAPGFGNERGVAYLFRGRAGPWPAALATADADAALLGEINDERAGAAVACLPDVDGDGLDDLLVAAPENDEAAIRAGQVYLVPGRTGAWPGGNITAAASASFLGENESSEAGTTVAAAGDLDGDGLDDLVIGAPHGRWAYDNGAIYTVLGAAAGWAMDVDLGIEAGHLWSLEPYSACGSALAAAGDLNGDGLGDLLVGDSSWPNVLGGEGGVHVLAGVGHVDADGDGFEPWDGDCDDGDPTVYPGAGEAADGVDNDCNGEIDDATELYDDDGDGFAEVDGDCDDADFYTNPAAPEYCNGLDDDCDGAPMATEVDDDGDGWLACADCDDADPAIHPGAAEVCDDGVDTDCGGDLTWTEVDDDGDGFSECGGDCNDLASWVFPGADETCDGVDEDCDPATDETVDGDGDGYSVCDGDCHDGDESRFPGADETCDGVDQDCDGEVDELDADGDGFGACDTGAGEVDCDDGDPAIHPGADEVPYDGVDDDCDGADLTDVDGDGFDGGDEGADCDDDDPAIHPGAAEVPYDGVDDDCDGADLTDVDADGFDAPPSGVDCDDLDPATHPDADELCDDGLDNDCDGLVDAAQAGCVEAPPEGGCGCDTKPNPQPGSTVALFVGIVAVGWRRRPWPSSRGRGA